MNLVTKFYEDKSIFVTGATGFLGKVLVEKLLRSCGDIKSIYLLIRTKKGVSANDRLESFKKHQIFEKIRCLNPSLLEKLKIIKGDILEDGLGIDNSDQQELIDNVNIVFHSAASVRFDLPLGECIENNVFGTYEVLNLAESMKKLEIFVHVSTLYCASSKVMEEKYYPVVSDPHKIIRSRGNYEDLIPLELRKSFPNSYTLSKAIGEDLVNTYKDKFRIAITRPSIVSSSVSEPFPGWIEGVNGPTGLMLALGKGVFRSFYCDPTSNVEAIPCDMAANAMIAVAWKRANIQNNEMYICNLSTADVNSQSWGQMYDDYMELLEEYPFDFSLWRPKAIVTNSYYLHKILTLLFQFIPAFFLDILLKLFGKKSFLLDTQRRIASTLECLGPFILTHWHFKTANFINLYKELNDKEQEIFFFDVKTIEWKYYLKNYLLGIKQYILKEKLENIKEARLNLKRLIYLDRFVSIICYVFSIYWLGNFVKYFW